METTSRTTGLNIALNSEESPRSSMNANFAPTNEILKSSSTEVPCAQADSALTSANLPWSVISAWSLPKMMRSIDELSFHLFNRRIASSADDSTFMASYSDMDCPLLWCWHARFGWTTSDSCSICYH